MTCEVQVLTIRTFEIKLSTAEGLSNEWICSFIPCKIIFGCYLAQKRRITPSSFSQWFRDLRLQNLIKIKCGHTKSGSNPAYFIWYIYIAPHVECYIPCTNPLIFLSVPAKQRWVSKHKHGYLQNFLFFIYYI